jgi:hypothetical protein
MKTKRTIVHGSIALLILYSVAWAWSYEAFLVSQPTHPGFITNTTPSQVDCE